MPNVKYQNSAMEYALWYQEHLLQMENVLGKRIEAKIEEIIDRKFDEYMEKARNEKNIPPSVLPKRDNK
jgi:hypothetical protein